MQSANFIGSIPEHYDRSLGPRIFNGFAEDLAARVATLTPASVLELAAGTGIVSTRVRALLPDCTLTVSDLNEPMLKVAEAKFSGDERIRFEQVDAMKIPYPDNTFDVLMCQFGVMFFPDKQVSFGEALRVLKPGGTYLFNAWGSWASNPFAEIAHETVAAFFPDNPPGFYKVPFHYHDADEISADLKAAGFTRIEIEEVVISSSIPSPSDFATGLVFGNPLHEEILDRGGDAEKIHAAVTQAIERKLGGQMPLQALVATAS